jgi:hypothetical protein
MLNRVVLAIPLGVLNILWMLAIVFVKMWAGAAVCLKISLGSDQEFTESATNCGLWISRPGLRAFSKRTFV